MKRKRPAHPWAFRTRFRTNSFGRRGTPVAKQALKVAISEIRAAGRLDPVLAGDGAVLLIERIWPALSWIDSSSGALGTAVFHAVSTLVDIILAANPDDVIRAEWLDRLWTAYMDDGVDYTLPVAERWGDLCGSPELASQWADRLAVPMRQSETEGGPHPGYYRGKSACFSSLLAAGRHQELLDILASERFKFWHDRKWGVKALVAMGKKAEAIRYAEESGEQSDHSSDKDRMCEEILLSSGLVEEAYRRYGVAANLGVSRLATFRAVVKKYPDKEPIAIFQDLLKRNPGEEGKWFATAKEMGLLDVAAALAHKSPCDPKTLARAARDHAPTHPEFAIEAGVAALHWLAEGYGYEITSLDVWMAYDHTMEAAKGLGREDEVKERVRRLLGNALHAGSFTAQILGRVLGLTEPQARSR